MRISFLIIFLFSLQLLGFSTNHSSSFSSLTTINNCPQSLSGFTVLGEWNNSKYFISDAATQWQTAQANAEANGGYLASITTQEENDFILQNISEIVFIGLNDENSEGNLEWASGESVDFSALSVSNNDTGDYGKMNFWNGNWGLDNQFVARRYIVEIPCGNSGTNLQVNCDFGIPGVIVPNDPAGTIVNWNIPAATTDCAEGITIEQTAGPSPGSFFDAGTDTYIEYIITDQCGNEEVCNTFVNVQFLVGELICPNDITVEATSTDGAVVFFDDPVSTPTGCIPASPSVVVGLPSGSEFPIGMTEVQFSSFYDGSNTFCQIGQVCSFNVTVLPQDGGGCPDGFVGFTTIGEFGGSKYYLSDGVSRPVDAQATAESNGGYLATISSQEENDFIQQNISEMVYIGLNDQNQEGVLEWFNGESFGYDNIEPCGICNENSEDMDFGIIQPWDGKWSFSNFWNQRKYVMEIPCDGDDFCGYITSTRPDELNIAPLNPNQYSATINGLTIDVKAIDEDGIELWSQNIPVPSMDSVVNEITQVEVVANQNEVWIYGAYRIQNNGIWRTYSIKLDLNGNVVAEAFHDSMFDFPTLQFYDFTAEGGLYLWRRNGSAVGVLYKIGSEGDILWQQDIIGDLVSNKIRFIGETPDESAVYLAIQEQSQFARIRKYNNLTGELIWDELLDSSNGGGTVILGGVVTQNGGVVASYNFNEFGIGRRHNYVRLDENGNVIWLRNFPDGLGFSNAIAATDDGGFIFFTDHLNVNRWIKVNENGLFEPVCSNNEKPELSLSRFTFDFTLNGFNVGTEVPYELTVNNNSLTSANGTYEISVYLQSLSPQPDIFLGNIIQENTPYGTNLINQEFTVPNVEEGNYRLKFFVDANEDIDELIETNNELISSNFKINGTGCQPNPLSGFIYLGEFEGSNYYLSEDVARPTDAQVEAENNGGYLAVINSQDENDYILNQLPNTLVYIGLHDAETEGTIEWINGDPVNFTNFEICSFCNENSDDMDYAIMHSWNGTWSWSNLWNQRRYVIEIPCNSSLTNPIFGNALIAAPSQQLDLKTIRLEKIHPNPAMDFIFTTVRSDQEKEVEVQIFDARGVMVKIVNVMLNQGDNTFQVDINDLSGGFYFVRIPDAQANYSSLRFVKMRD